MDPAKFIPNNDLGSSPALVNRDYNYLLNFERKIKLGKSDIKENAKQVFKRTFNQHKNNNKRPRLDGSLEEEDSRLALVRAAFPNVTTTSIKRDNILVISLPAGMSRSTQNKSGYDKKSSTFTWTMEWVPLSNSGTPMKPFISFRLKESSPLKDLAPASILAKYYETESIETESLYFYLENCVGALGKLSLIPLSVTDTLASALKDRIVLEFPKVYVSLTPVLDADFSASDGYGPTKPASDSETSDSDSDSDSDSESDTDLSDSDSSLEDSESDSDGAPEEESSKKPEEVVQETSVGVDPEVFNEEIPRII